MYISDRLTKVRHRRAVRPCFCGRRFLSNGGRLVFNRIRIRRPGRVIARGRGALFAAVLALGGAVPSATADPHGEGEGPPADGQTVFRHDTFGDEAFWTDQLKMNAVIEGAIDPVTA